MKPKNLAYQTRKIEDYLNSAYGDANEIAKRLPVGHLSHSSIDTFLRCPLQFQRKYIWKEPERKSTSLLEGGVMTKTLESAYKAAMNDEGFWSDAGPVEIYLIDKYESIFEQETKDIDPGSSPYQDDQRPADAIWTEIRTRANGFLRKFADMNCGPDYQPRRARGIVPCGVEFEVTHNVRGLVPILGYIDLLEKKRIVDWKVTRERYLNPQQSFQLSLYAYCLKIPNVALVGFCKDTGKIIIRQDKRDMKLVKVWVEYVVLSACKAILDGISVESAGFPPCNPSFNILCDPRWCSYYSHCYGSVE